MCESCPRLSLPSDCWAAALGPPRSLFYRTGVGTPHGDRWDRAQKSKPMGGGGPGYGRCPPAGPSLPGPCMERRPPPAHLQAFRLLHWDRPLCRGAWWAHRACEQAPDAPMPPPPRPERGPRCLYLASCCGQVMEALMLPSPRRARLEGWPGGGEEDSVLLGADSFLFYGGRERLGLRCPPVPQNPRLLHPHPRPVAWREARAGLPSRRGAWDRAGWASPCLHPCAPALSSLPSQPRLVG